LLPTKPSRRITEPNTAAKMSSALAEENPRRQIYQEKMERERLGLECSELRQSQEKSSANRKSDRDSEPQDEYESQEIAQIQNRSGKTENTNEI
jgi:hypothetical protein